MYSRAALIDSALVVWFALTALTAAYVAWDAFRRNPEMMVMKWGWVLVTFYAGPVGGLLYVLSCQEPATGQHEKFIRPLWKQGLGSTIHCLAGDATGIILAAAVTMAMGLRMWQDLVAEYVFGFAMGLLVFQALFMRDMLGGSYGRALRASLLPEWLSMNAVMAGMTPVMVVLMSRDMLSMEPSSLHFWGVVTLATLAGFAVAYPINVWLVAAGLKHGMGTARVFGKGGQALATEATGSAIEPRHSGGPTTSATKGRSASAEMIASELAPRPSGSRGTVPRSARTLAADATESAPLVHQSATTMSMPHGTRATPAQLFAVSGFSLVMLAAGVFVAALAGDVTMRGQMREHRSMPNDPAHDSMAGHPRSR